MQQRIPITEVREWNDAGLSELIQPFTDPTLNSPFLDDDHARGGIQQII
jgi:hypothetical protein